MNIGDMLDRSLTIQRMTVGKSPSGAAIRTPAAIVSSVAFCVAPAEDRVVDFYARRELVVDYTLYTNAVLPTLISATATHRAGVAIRDLVTDLASGETWVVLGKKYYANAGVSDETLWELHCQMQDNPVT